MTSAPTVTYADPFRSNLRGYQFSKNWDINNPKCKEEAQKLINKKANGLFVKHYFKLLLVEAICLVVFPLVPLVHDYFVQKMVSMAKDEFKHDLAKTRNWEIEHIRQLFIYNPTNVDAAFDNFYTRFISDNKKGNNEGNFQAEAMKNAIKATHFHGIDSLKEWRTFKKECNTQKNLPTLPLIVN